LGKLAVHVDAFDETTPEGAFQQLFGKLLGPAFEIDDVDRVINDVTGMAAPEALRGVLIMPVNKLLN
jgi:hypothetical protein